MIEAPGDGSSGPQSGLTVQAAALALAETALEGDVARVAEGAARRGGLLITADRSSIALAEPGGDLVIAASVELRSPQPPARFPPGQGVAGWVASTGRSLLIPDVDQDPRYVRIHYPRPRSLLAVPLFAQKRLVGVLACTAYRPAAFGPREEMLLNSFAPHAGIAIRQAQLLASGGATTWEDELLVEAVHDLRGPLQAAMGFLDLALASNNAEAGPETDITAHLHSARAEVQRALALAAATLEARTGVRSPASPQPTDISSLVRTALLRVTPIAFQKGVLLDVRTTTGLPLAHADPEAVARVLLELLLNALRISPAGSTISIATKTRDDMVLVEIDDQGPGLPASAGSSTDVQGPTGQSGRIGLGLTICRRIVERNGGQLGTANRPEGGARVWFTLPVASHQ